MKKNYLSPAFVYDPLYKATFASLKLALCGQGVSPLTPEDFFPKVKKLKRMAYGIIRVRNLSAGDIRHAEIHNAREYEAVGLNTPDNIDPNGHHTHWVAGDQEKSISQAINERLDSLGIKTRSNSVVAIEYVVALTGTPDERKEMWHAYSESGFLAAAQQWVAERHGGMANVVAISQHYDETNPHAHIIVLPVVEKSIKWKNQNGSGERKEHRLCARDITGHPDKLRKLQDDYHAFVEPFGPKMGVKFYRGTKKEEQLKEYTKATSHELGRLRAELDQTKDKARAKAIELEIEAKKAEFEKTQGKVGREVEIHKQQNGKDEKWKQKKDFNITF